MIFIATVEIDKTNFFWLEGLRRQHFPAERNLLSAHLTMFHHLSEAQMTRLTQAALPAAHAEGWQQIVLNIFPENIALAVAQNQILQVAVFALLFGTALATMPEAKRAPLVSVLQSLTETMFRLTRIITYMAPLAAGAAMAYTVGSMGLATLLPLVKLVATYYAALIAFVLCAVVPSLMIARISLGGFVRAIAEPAAVRN